ncbi:Protein TRANSPARENT TESTA 12 [Zea mays]|uniref:Protein TRANSPARENT TESTA 12 n=1 Tax=Zea mays TaxID=4577 RepID=A0A1D6N648_MAIZE|nr:Protein TRANSPARENT TESTA 12 [Zea mays]
MQSSSMKREISEAHDTIRFGINAGVKADLAPPHPNEIQKSFLRSKLVGEEKRITGNIYDTFILMFLCFLFAAYTNLEFEHTTDLFCCKCGMAWLGLQLRVLVVRDPCAVCRADARLSSQHFHHCNVVVNLTYSSYYHHSFRQYIKCTRVSNELGARNIANARKALTVSLALSLMLGVAFLLLLGLGHDLWVRLFITSEAVVSAFASMTPLLIGSVVLDSTQGYSAASPGATGAVDGADMQPPLPELRPLFYHPANQLAGVRPDHIQQGQRFCLLGI